jgi:hypothetical protein
MTTPSATITAAAKNNLLPTLPFCNYISPPVVSWYGKGFCLSFLLGRGEVVNRELGYQVWAPSLLAVYDAKTSGFVEIRAVKPTDFGRSDDRDAPIGAGISPPHKHQAAYLEKQIKLFEATDAWLAALQAKSPVPEVQKLYKERLVDITEPPLWPYVERLLLKPA